MARPGDDPRFGPGDVRLGQVIGLHGLDGEVKVFLYNPASTLFGAAEAGAAVRLVGPAGQVRAVRLHLRPGAGKRILARIEGVADREAAEALHGYEIVLDADALPPLPDDEWYQRDLLGLPVRTASGQALGRIAEIHTAGEVDVWILRGKGERVLPALKAHLVSVRTRAQAGDAAEVVVTDDAVDDRPPL